MTTSAPALSLSGCCPVCDGEMVRRNRAWLFGCKQCGFLASTLQPHIDNKTDPRTIDEDAREKSLGFLREKNFARVLDRLGQLRIGGRLLDVGCAHGWFLEQAGARGYDVVGLEPDAVIRDKTVGRGLKAWAGFFPDDIPAAETFDVIVFNDVLEHIPDVTEATEACNRLLRPGGHLVLNIPSSRGVFYRTAAALDAIGIKGPLERMWQSHFHSPHVSYFTPDQLSRFTGRHGFIEKHRSTLPSLSVGELWARLRYDKTASVVSSMILFAAVGAMSPLLGVLPADISLQIFEKR